jgi:cysteine-rich repeat protein
MCRRLRVALATALAGGGLASAPGCAPRGSSGDEDGGSESAGDADDSTDGESSGSAGDGDGESSDTDAGSECGDGIVEGDELCDDGPDNGAYDHCTAGCDGHGPHCGDGVVDGPEACDDGDADGLDGCDNACRVQACGDGEPAPGELCFGPFDECAVGHDPGPLLVVDLDGDDHLDVVLGELSENRVEALAGDGTGALEALGSVPGPPLPHVLIAAHVDGDAALDVVAVGRTEGLHVLFGDGDGGLSPGPAAATALSFASAADLDGDAQADVVVGGTAQTQVQLGAGDGTFTTVQTIDHPERSGDFVVLVDLDGDLVLDLVLALDELDSLAPVGEIETWRGLGDGSFEPIESHPLADDADVIRTAALDADARPDLAVLRGSQPCGGLWKSCGGADWLHPSLGEVTSLASQGALPGALEPTTSEVIGFDPADLALGDLDHDGWPDGAVAHAALGWLEVLRGDGAGGLGPGEVVDQVGFRHADIELADLDEDGALDLLLTRSALGDAPGSLRVRLADP